MFSYSIARHLSIKNSAKLVIDSVSGFSRDYVYNRNYQLDHFSISARKATKSERLLPFSRIRRKLLKWYSYLFQFEFRQFVYQGDVDFDRRMLNLKCKNKLFLEGYWQSENYFKDIETVIREDLKIIPPSDSLNISLAEKMAKCTSVAIHVRFFNPVGDGKTSNVSKSYYKKAIREIQERIEVGQFFIFSENPELAREMLALDVKNATFISHNKGDENAYADMWLMTKCKHFIIANSTFSWWGAWLANYSNKVVIAPKSITKYNGSVSWGFDGLLPDEWIKL